ncbi:hypothetical protein LUZ60_011908 [Juncus effusus]|nr:hypothetical protein LUZ60_011908 [Juncus effusus]
MVEEKMKKKRRRREKEIIEAALAAAGASLAISVIKNLLIPSLLNQLPWLSSLDPPPFLFLLLNLVIASIVIASIDLIQPTYQRNKKRRRKESVGLSDRLDCVKEKEEREKEGEEEGDAEELNRRVEAFIMAFRHQLRVDSFSSHVHGSNAAAA